MDTFGSILGLNSPDNPRQPSPPPIGDAPIVDSDELARQRALIERGRRGRASLVRDPAMSTPGSSGMGAIRPML